MPDYEGSTSIGLAYLSANLKKHGHQVSVFHITKDISEETFLNQVSKYNYDLIGFTAFSNQNYLIKKYAKWVRNISDKPTIYGGVHPTVDPEDAISIDGVDMICLGEGEDVIVELCNKLENKQDVIDIQSLWIKHKSKVIKNPIRALRQDLDSLPFPDLNIFDTKKTVQWKIESLEVLTTRGCQYNCSYCCNHQYRKLYKNSLKYVRTRTVDNIIKEIKERKEKFPELNHVVLLDDTFGMDKKFGLEFCKKIKQEINMPWRTNTHAQVLDEEMIIAMKDSGCRRISIGIESGDLELRKSVLNRKLSDESIIKACELCNEHGIEVMTYNMVGIPFETREKALKTIKLNTKTKTNPRLIHMSILQPYPKTKIYDICVENGFIKKEQVPDSYFSESIVDQPSMSKNEAIFVFEYFYIFLKIYQFIDRLPRAIKNNFDIYVDTIFLKANPKYMLKLKNPINVVVFPIQTIKKFLLTYFPNISRKIKNKFYPTYKKL
jgi:radical SAM superfamily enzyme YgiQ (UPF0313 family)